MYFYTDAMMVFVHYYLYKKTRHTSNNMIILILDTHIFIFGIMDFRQGNRMSTTLVSKYLKSKGPESNYMYCLKIDMTKGPLSKPKKCMYS